MKVVLRNLLSWKQFIILSLILIMICVISISAYAKDFGIQGHTNKIVEQPFLQMIDQRLQKLDMEKEQKKMVAIVKDRVKNPVAVEGINPATSNRVFYFDPTYRLDKDIILPCGKILHKAGTMVNPLAHMDLSRRMLFIDSRERKQISWLKKQLDNPPSGESEAVEDRIILLGGSVFKLQEELGAEHSNKVYFDQGGELINKFGIKASPAVVMQEGLGLKIEEIVIK